MFVTWHKSRFQLAQLWPLKENVTGQCLLFARGLSRDLFGNVCREELEWLLYLLTVASQDGNVREVCDAVVPNLSKLHWPCPKDVSCEYIYPLLPPPVSVMCAQGMRDMVELYYMALVRDVPFSEWTRHPLVRECCRHMGTNLDNLFRGPTTGDGFGDFLSKFLTVTEIADFAGQDSGKTWDEALARVDPFSRSRQQLQSQEQSQSQKSQQWSSLRDWTSVLMSNHWDPVQPFVTAIQMLHRSKCPLNGCSPTGSALVEYMYRVSQVCIPWLLQQQWIHRKALPEELSLLIAKRNAQLPCTLIYHPVLRHGRLLCSPVPTDKPCIPRTPAFPCIPAAQIGICAAVLKAAFQCNSAASMLTRGVRVGEELDKLASNMGLVFCAAGLQTRSDVEQSMDWGEKFALRCFKRDKMFVDSKFTTRSGHTLVLC